jgi:hypothetical protein
VKHSALLVAANVVFAVLFVISAGLQYNDPDPIRWAALYGGAAVATIAALHVRGAWIAALAIAVLAAVWGATLWHSVAGHVQFSDFWRKMSEKGGKVEEMREAGGLSIVATWLTVSGLAGLRRSRR